MDNKLLHKYFPCYFETNAVFDEDIFCAHGGISHTEIICFSFVDSEDIGELFDTPAPTGKNQESDELEG